MLGSIVSLEKSSNKASQADLRKLASFLQKDAKKQPIHSGSCWRRYVFKEVPVRSSLILLTILLGISTTAQAVKFKYKNIEDFKTLSVFSSVEKFEQNYQNYTQDCLDNTGGGTGGIKCYIGYKMWDRELNIYYKKTNKSLADDGKILLKKSQLTWIKERDQSIDFNSYLLNKEYSGQIGTMYSLMRAADTSSAIVPIVRQRALVLKKWSEYIN